MGRGGNIIQGAGQGARLTLVHSRPPQSVEVDNTPSARSSFSNSPSFSRLPEAHNAGPIGRSLSEFAGAGFDAWLDDNEELLVRRAAHLAGHKIESASHLKIFWEAWSRGTLDPLTDRSSIESFEHDNLLSERFSDLVKTLESPSSEVGFKSLLQIALFFEDDVMPERFTSEVVQSIRITAEEFLSTAHVGEKRIRAALALQRVIIAIPEGDRDTVILQIIGVLGNAVTIEHTAVNLSALQALDTVVQKVPAIPSTFSADIESMPGVLDRISAYGSTEEVRGLAESIRQHLQDRFIPAPRPIPAPQALRG